MWTNIARARWSILFFLFFFSPEEDGEATLVLSRMQILGELGVLLTKAQLFNWLKVGAVFLFPPRKSGRERARRLLEGEVGGEPFDWGEGGCLEVHTGFFFNKECSKNCVVICGAFLAFFFEYKRYKCRALFARKGTLRKIFVESRCEWKRQCVFFFFFFSVLERSWT